MSKVLAAGGEVDSYCTKCKMILNHRIIAMKGSQPARVECSTCSSHHNYRARMPGVKAPGKEKPVVTGRLPRVTSASKTVQAQLEREKTWEAAIAGHAVHEFKKYRVSEIFNTGDLISHTKFGDGVVVQVLDPRKVEILFKDEPRTLAQGLTD